MAWLLSSTDYSLPMLFLWGISLVTVTSKYGRYIVTRIVIDHTTADLYIPSQFMHNLHTCTHRWCTTELGLVHMD